jgi:addiction module HigA family antidote
MHNPPHPGEVLRDAIDGLGMTVTDFAAHIGVARSTVTRVLNGSAGISADMSIRLAEALEQPTRDIWLKMQADYDFWQATQTRRKKIRPVRKAA